MLEGCDKDFAVPDLAGLCGLRNGLDGLIDHALCDGNIDLDLG